jgi:hypothetical protein
MCGSWSRSHTKAEPIRQVSILGKAEHPLHKEPATDTNFEAEQALFARSKDPSMEARLLRAMAAAAILAALVVLAAPAAAQGADDSDALAYRNHTVGGKDGWFFDATTNTSSGNYSDWANGETFYLGDYLSKLIDTFFSLSLSLSLSRHCCSASSWFPCLSTFCIVFLANRYGTNQTTWSL